jgi:hypothetical protein
MIFLDSKVSTFSRTDGMDQALPSDSLKSAQHNFLEKLKLMFYEPVFAGVPLWLQSQEVMDAQGHRTLAARATTL